MNVPIETTTRRFPRTLQEAFGPYTDYAIETEPHCFFRSAWRFLRTLVRSFQ